MEMLAIIVGSTGGVIACCAVLGIMLVRHVQPFGCHDVNEVIQGLQAFRIRFNAKCFKSAWMPTILAGSYWLKVHILLSTV